MRGEQNKSARWFAGMVAGCLLAGSLTAQVHEGIELVRAELLADSETIVPGRPVTLGLHLRMAPDWHTYWEYPGDAGMATRFELELPEGFRATELQWPVPKHWIQPGNLEGYGYEDEVLLLARVYPPINVEAGEIEIRGSASWLVCKELCLPGSADLSIRLQVADTVQPANTELFDRFREQLPRLLRNRPGEPAQVGWEKEGSDLVLRVEGPAAWKYSFYPLPSPEIMIGRPETVAGGDGASIRVPLRNAPDDVAGMEGVLVAETDEGELASWRVRAQ